MFCVCHFLLFSVALISYSEILKFCVRCSFCFVFCDFLMLNVTTENLISILWYHLIIFFSREFWKQLNSFAFHYLVVVDLLIYRFYCRKNKKNNISLQITGKFKYIFFTKGSIGFSFKILIVSLCQTSLVKFQNDAIHQRMPLYTYIGLIFHRRTSSRFVSTYVF